MLKTIQLFLIGAVTFVLGGIGGLFMEQRVVPALVEKDWARNLPLVKDTRERTTIIERSENITITEDAFVPQQLSVLRPSLVLVTSRLGAVTQEGSGVFVTSDGIIAVMSHALMTNKNAELSVFYPNGVHMAADLIGVDAVTGIAFVRVEDGRDHSAVSFSRIEDVAVGQRLVEAGIDAAARDYMYATVARVSAVMPSAFASAQYAWQGTLDVDARARQLSSVLVTARGELAGLVGTTVDGDVEALPVSAVRFALDRLVADRLEDVVDLGVTYESVLPTTMSADANAQGVIVQSVVASSRAARAGVHAGDHVLTVNGIEIVPGHVLAALLDEAHSVPNITLTLLRDGEEVIITIPNVTAETGSDEVQKSQ